MVSFSKTFLASTYIERFEFSYFCKQHTLKYLFGTQVIAVMMHNILVEQTVAGRGSS